MRSNNVCLAAWGCAAAAAGAALLHPPRATADAFIGANFQGINGAAVGLQPPDTMGAPGIDHFVQFINGRFTIYNKSTGSQISSDSSFTFWTNAGLSFGGADSRSDPRIVFDPSVNRWFVSQVDVVGSSSANANNL